MIFILNIHYGNTDDRNHAAGDDITDDNDKNHGIEDHHDNDDDDDNDENDDLIDSGSCFQIRSIPS